MNRRHEIMTTTPPATLAMLSPIDAVTNEVLAFGLPARRRLSLRQAAWCDLHAVERAVDRLLPLADHVLSERIRVRRAAMDQLATSRPSRVHAARQRAIDLRRHRRSRRAGWSS